MTAIFLWEVNLVAGMDAPHELFEDQHGFLVSQTIWESRIKALKEMVILAEDKILDSTISAAVASRSSSPLALLLSGGVDSSLLALLLKLQSANFIACCVGIEGSQDLKAAKAVADLLKIPLNSRVITIDDLKDTIDEVCPHLKQAMMDNRQNLSVLFGVSAVEWTAIRLAKENGFDYIMGGLGSEEIFAGYDRHAKAKESGCEGRAAGSKTGCSKSPRNPENPENPENPDTINAECWRGLEAMWGRDLVRDSAIASALKVKVLTPYLDTSLIRHAMGIPGALKIKEGIKKYCLRQSALRLGLPKKFAFRPKKAAQYGSGFDKAIEKLAKRGGFSSKHDFLAASAGFPQVPAQGNG